MFRSSHLVDLCRRQMTLQGKVDYHKFHQKVSSLSNVLFADAISNVIVAWENQHTSRCLLLTCWSDKSFFLILVVHWNSLAVIWQCQQYTFTVPPQWHASFPCYITVEQVANSHDSIRDVQIATPDPMCSRTAIGLAQHYRRKHHSARSKCWTPCETYGSVNYRTKDEKQSSKNLPQ